MESVGKVTAEGSRIRFGGLGGQELRMTPLEGSLSFQLSPLGALASWPPEGWIPTLPHSQQGRAGLVSPQPGPALLCPDGELSRTAFWPLPGPPGAQVVIPTAKAHSCPHPVCHLPWFHVRPLASGSLSFSAPHRHLGLRTNGTVCEAHAAGP